MFDGPPPLYKTTIVIWSRFEGTSVGLETLGHEAERGEAYCSVSRSEFIEDPSRDPAWDGTEFFFVGNDQA